MKSLLASLAISLCIALTGYSQKPPVKTADFQTAVKKEVEATIRSFMAGFSIAKCDDVTPVTRFVRDKMIYVGEKDIYTVSFADYEQGVRDRVCGWVSHSGVVESVVVDALSKDVAVAAWLFQDEFKLKSGEIKKVKGSVLMTLVKSADGWKITSTKSTEP